MVSISRQLFVNLPTAAEAKAITLIALVNFFAMFALVILQTPLKHTQFIDKNFVAESSDFVGFPALQYSIAFAQLLGRQGHSNGFQVVLSFLHV